MTGENYRQIPWPTISPPTSKDGRPTYRITYQLAAELGVNQAGNCFHDAARTILLWMKNRFSTDLPGGAFSGSSFEIDEGLRSLECSSVPGEGLWSIRMRHQDEAFAGLRAVSGRNWIVDAGLRAIDGRTHFGLRLMCVSDQNSTSDIMLSRPGVVARLARQCGMSEIRVLDGLPWTLQSKDDLDQLHALLVNPTRSLPVILLSQPNPAEFPVPVREFLLDGKILANRLLGLAHLVQLPHHVGYQWTERVGKQWSTYRGAVRTYMPGLDFKNDSPGDHPFATAQRIIFWQGDGENSEAAFENFIAEKVGYHAASKRIQWGDVLFFSDARSRELELVRVAAVEDSAWKDIYEEEIRIKESQIDQKQRDYENAWSLAEENERRCTSLKEENVRLMFRIDSLMQSLKEKTQIDPDAEIAMPDGYGSMAEWVDENLAGRLVLHPRARHAIKEAVYEDHEHVAKSLLGLAKEYRDMKIGIGIEGEAKIAYDEMLKNLQLRPGGSISRQRAGEEGDTYFVEYPLGSGKKHFLELHLRNLANTRQPERCLAIYFFWYEDTRQVVVGWLPSHLDNRLT